MNQAMQRLVKKGLLWLAEDSSLSSIEANEPRLSFGINDLDSTLPFKGLPSAATHEFIMLPPATDIPAYPPVTVPLILAERSFTQHINKQTQEAPFLVFIGKQCWPSIYLIQSLFLYHQQTLPRIIQSQILYLDPPEQKHFWCIEKSLRSAAVSTIVSTLRYCPPALSRRFSLLARHHGTTALFIRPPSELPSKGFFYSRWTIAHTPSAHPGPVWRVHLRHIQGTRSLKNTWDLSLHCKEHYEHNSIQEPSLSLHLLPNHRERPAQTRESNTTEPASRLYYAS